MFILLLGSKMYFKMNKYMSYLDIFFLYVDELLGSCIKNRIV